MGGPYFPPTSIRVRRRGSFFNPCPTFSIYVGRLSKACQMMGFDSSGWIDSGSQAIIKGLKHARDFTNRFCNFILRDLWVKILRWETIDSEFGRLSYIGFIFALRIQSEAYPSILATDEDDLLNRSPMRYPVLIGLREVSGETKLILKLKKRKQNERKISILMRPCF